MIYNYLNNCVNWPENDVDTKGGLSDLIGERISISRTTFLKHVNRDDLSELESLLGYASHPKQGLTMPSDWHVEYFRSKLHGKRVYGFRHSAIEYVFAADPS